MKKLASAELKLGKVTYENSDKVAKGLCIDQSRAVGAKTPVGTTVDFVMSLGPVEETTAGTAGEPTSGDGQ